MLCCPAALRPMARRTAAAPERALSQSVARLRCTPGSGRRRLSPARHGPPAWRTPQDPRKEVGTVACEISFLPCPTRPVYRMATNSLANAPGHCPKGRPPNGGIPSPQDPRATISIMAPFVKRTEVLSRGCPGFVQLLGQRSGPSPNGESTHRHSLSLFPRLRPKTCPVTLGFA
jgi:hypothetical protein